MHLPRILDERAFADTQEALAGRPYLRSGLEGPDVSDPQYASAITAFLGSRLTAPPAKAPAPSGTTANAN